MTDQIVVRKVLQHAADFKKFWKDEGPFRYALTSSVFPFILLDDEEWLFSEDMEALLKELMQWRQRNMMIIRSPVAEKRKNRLRIDTLSQWQIKNFPGEWSALVSDLFTSVGHLTQKAVRGSLSENNKEIERRWFKSLEHEIENLGYTLLKPLPASGADTAYVDDYLKEWMRDEADAGLL